MKIIGDKSKLAFVVGEFWQNSRQHQTIEVWLDGRNFFDVENTVYLPTFYTKLNNEISRLKSDSFYREEFKQLDKSEIYALLEDREDDHFKVLCYDVTTCSAHSYLVDDGKKYSVIYAFWDPRHEPETDINNVYSVDIDKNEMLNVMRCALDSLSTTWF